MTPKELLTPMIEQELTKYGYNDPSRPLRALTALKKKMTKRCVIWSLVSCLLVYLAPLAWFFIIRHYQKKKKTLTNADAIFEIAKTYPDTPVDQLVQMEVGAQ